MSSCSIEDCSKPRKAKGYCSIHYARFCRHGDPLAGRGYRALVPASCSVEGCGATCHALGYCTRHYAAFRRNGPELAKSSPHGNRKYADDATCAVADCTRSPIAKELCGAHYGRARVKGDPDAARPLRQRDARWIDSAGYVRVGSRRLEHRVVMEEVLGRPLRPFENVHHINGVRTDNRPENLELWVKPQPNGQRVEDLVAWVLSEYPSEVAAALSMGVAA